MVSKGFTELKQSAYTYAVKSRLLIIGYRRQTRATWRTICSADLTRCLYSVQKFDSEAERKLAVILDRDAIKWFKPAKGQFQIFYRQGADHLEYQPDFVAETAETIFMLEPKASNQMDDPIVLAKKEVAVKWCTNASDHAQSYGGKPWRYA